MLAKSLKFAEGTALPTKGSRYSYLDMAKQHSRSVDREWYRPQGKL